MKTKILLFVSLLSLISCTQNSEVSMGSTEPVDLSLTSLYTYYSAKAEEGDTNAMLEVAEMYMKGRGVKKDTVKALNYIKRAAAKDDLNAILKLVRIYAKGVKHTENIYSLGEWIIEPNKETENNLTAKLFERAKILSESNDISANNLLGNLYSEGIDKLVTQDPLLAYEHLDKAITEAQNKALNGDLEATFWLAQYYEYGNSVVTQNLEKSLGYYQQLADKGYKKAIYILAKAYYSDKCCRPIYSYVSELKLENDNKASGLLLPLANNGDMIAQEKIGRNLFYSCKDEDLVCWNESKEWLSKSLAQYPDDNSYEQVGEIELHLQNYPSALENYLKAIEISPHPNGYRQNTLIKQLASILEGRELYYVQDINKQLIPFVNALPQDLKNKITSRFLSVLRTIESEYKKLDESDKGRSSSLMLLARIYEEGLLGITPDIILAERYMKKAKET